MMEAMAQTQPQHEGQTTPSFHCESDEPYIDRLIRFNAQHHPEQVILSYPNIKGEYYVNLTGADLERVSAYVASKYAEVFRTFPNGEVPGEIGYGGLQTKIVAIISLSTLASHIAWAALHRLGFSPLAISPRLAKEGYTYLCQKVGCRTILAAGASLDMAYKVKETFPHPLEVVPMLDDDAVLEGLTSPKVDLPVPTGLPGIVNHTGGTTGLPKPVAQGMSRWHNLPAVGSPGTIRTLPTLPMFHASGLGQFFMAMRGANQVCLLSPYRPITASIVLKALDDTGANRLSLVPYILKCVAEHEGGVARLAQLDAVNSIGSAIPDELGDMLVSNGVPLINRYGQTESGVTMDQSGHGVGQWNWLTPIPAAEKCLKFEQVGEDIYHLVCLASWPNLKESNRPDGSYETRDLFRPHPDNLPGSDTRAGLARWKYLARQGDILVLVNGENADPTPIEQAVMFVPEVQMAVAFGAGHERVGLLVVPSERAVGLSQEMVIDKIRPALERGNALAANYARISPDDVIVKPVGTEYPQSHKFTLNRPILNRFFAKDIESHYEEREKVSHENSNKAWTGDEIRETVRDLVQTELQSRGLLHESNGNSNGSSEKHVLSDEDDFFNLGMDSLMSSLVRKRLLQTIPLPPDVTLATNVVFEFPSVGLLSQHITHLREQKTAKGMPSARNPATIAQALLAKYIGVVRSGASTPLGTAHKGGETTDQGQVVVLTGATGYIGAQLLKTLLNNPKVARVYCLVRTRYPQDHANAQQRITDALVNSQLSSEIQDATKLRCLSSNLAAADLGLSPSEYDELSSSVTAVIHNAWSVNFNLSLESFEPNIASTAHLLNLSRGQKPRTFVFISSVASVGAAILGRMKAEERLYNWEEARPHNGYGQSKWIAEQICAAAAQPPTSAHGPVRILRVAQVSGDTKHGVWNPAEAIPTMVQSALTIGALPEMEDKRNTLCWLPSDVTAAAIADLTFVDAARTPPLSIFHVSSPHTLSWNEKVLPAVQHAGLAFKRVPASEWVRLLESSTNIEANPPYKLIEHYRTVYGSRDKGGGRESPWNDKSDKDAGLVRLDLTQSLKHSSTLRDAPTIDVELVSRYVHHWQRHWAGKKTRGG